MTLKLSILLVVAMFGFQAGAAPQGKTPVAEAIVTPDQKIPDDDLEGFRKGCLYGADKSLPLDSTTKYCDCFKNRMAQTVSREEYVGYTSRFSSSGKPVGNVSQSTLKLVEQKMTGLMSECSALIEPVKEKKIR